MPRIAVTTIANQLWPWLTQSYTHPKYGTPCDAKTIISDLNGFTTREGHWSRTQIADWVASVEPQEDIVGEMQPNCVLHEQAI